MTKAGAPLRFAIAVLGLWLGARGWWLWSDRDLVVTAQPAAAMAEWQPRSGPSVTVPIIDVAASAPIAWHASAGAARSKRVSLAQLMAEPIEGAELPARSDAPRIAPAQLQGTAARKIGGSAWLFVRPGSQGGLAPGGQYGGSQVGARIEIALRPKIALGLRGSAALARPHAPEAAIGLILRPTEGLALTAERRIALGPGGRNGFAAFASGGFWKPGLPLGLILDGYGQAGMVGLRRRNLFADGALRLARPLDTPAGARFGIGAWGAAQPGSSRLDIGPHLTTPLRLGHRNAALALDGRIRVAGNAAPGSGVALTLSSDF